MQTIMILQKNDFLIRVKKSPEDSYALEYSKDRFRTIQTKLYENRDKLMEVLTWRFTEEELIGI